MAVSNRTVMASACQRTPEIVKRKPGFWHDFGKLSGDFRDMTITHDHERMTEGSIGGKMIRFCGGSPMRICL